MTKWNQAAIVACEEAGPLMWSGDECGDAFHCNQENRRYGEIDICGTDWSTVPGSRNGTKTLT